MKGYLFPTAKAEAVPYTPLPSLPTSLLRNNQYSHCGHCTNDESLCDPVAMADPSSLPLPATAHGEGARSPQHAAAVIPQHHRASSNSSDGMDAATTVPHASFASRVMAPASEWYEEMRWSRGGAKMSKSMRWVLIVSYAPDWIFTLLTAGLLQLIDNVYGFRREFSLTDTSIQHTHALSERISVSLLAVLAFIVPLLLMAIVALGVSRSVWDFHAGLLGLVTAHAITLTATTIIKVAVGRPRPDLIDRCQPRAGAANAVPYGLTTEAVCTTDPRDHLLSDGFRSFPSGHSSTAFAGLTFLTLWLAGKVHLWQRGRGSSISAWLLFLPMFGATMIAISRTMDYRHHATDVIAGGVLGFVVALSIYYNYYPPLWHHSSQKPWSPRNTAAHRRWLTKAAHAHHSNGNGNHPRPGVLPDAYKAEEEEEAPHFAINDAGGIPPSDRHYQHLERAGADPERRSLVGSHDNARFRSGNGSSHLTAHADRTYAGPYHDHTPPEELELAPNGRGRANQL